MGFFKKIFSGIGKVFRKIGRGIKKGFAKFGKFMNKFGIVGQLAMMFIIPGIGGALMKGFGAMAGNMSALTGAFQGMSGAMGAIVKGAGTVLKAAHGFVQTGVNAFKTVTSGLMEFGKTALNKIPGINIEGASANFFGKNSVMEGITLDAKNILNPFKNSTTLSAGSSLKDLSSSTGLSVEELAKLNPNTVINESTFGELANSGAKLNLDYGNIAPDMQSILDAAANPTATALPSDAFGVDQFDVGKIGEAERNQFNLEFSQPESTSILPADNIPTLENLGLEMDAPFDPTDFRVPSITDNIQPQAQSLLAPDVTDLGKINTNFDVNPYDPASANFGEGMTIPGQDDLTRGVMGTNQVGIRAPNEVVGNTYLDRAKAGVSRSLSNALDDPIGTGLPMASNLINTFTPEEIVEQQRRGYVADVLPQFQVGTTDYSQIFNAGSYGASAGAYEFLRTADSYNNPNRFPGAIQAGATR